MTSAPTKLTILGSGTCNLVPDKAAASVLMEWPDGRLVYDFGRGTAIRLVEYGLRQDDIGAVFLSHFHPDHVTDLLPYLHAASWSQIDPRTAPLAIYGPPGTQAFVERLLAVFGKDELSRTFKLTIQEVTAGPATIAGHTYEVIDLHHSHGLRFGDYAIAGDAHPSDDLTRLLSGATLAVFDSGHLTDQQIVEVAAASQAERLICSHQYRPLEEANLNQLAKQTGYKGKLIVAHDLMEFDFTEASKE